MFGYHGRYLPRERLTAMIQGYYQACGWNSDGTIPRNQLVELALSEYGG
jgi:hypothetical protein